MKELTEEQKQIYLKRMQEETKEKSVFECCHKEADNILCEILTELGGFEDILKAYHNVGKWYA